MPSLPHRAGRRTACPITEKERPDVTTRALVLGGGGVTGVAWELGLLEGLRRAGVDLTGADTVIGTSAGSVVGVRVARDEVTIGYEGQLLPPDGELPAKLGATTLLKLGVMLARRGETSAKWQRVGKAALAAHPESPEARKDVIRARIGDGPWPDGDLRVIAVDTDQGELAVFTRDSGATLLDAVAASCAVPLVWPPVVINGTTYVDGGIRSATNADLAEGSDVIVVLAPTTQTVSREHTIARQLERSGAATTLVVTPDALASQEMGSNALDPAHRKAAAETGLRQGALVAEQVAAVWG